MKRLLHNIKDITRVYCEACYYGSGSHYVDILLNKEQKVSFFFIDRYRYRFRDRLYDLKAIKNKDDDCFCAVFVEKEEFRELYFYLLELCDDHLIRQLTVYKDKYEEYIEIDDLVVSHEKDTSTFSFAFKKPKSFAFSLKDQLHYLLTGNLRLNTIEIYDIPLNSLLSSMNILLERSEE